MFKLLIVAFMAGLPSITGLSHENYTQVGIYPVPTNTNTNTNTCVQFTVSSGTGCAWMCSYCANQLGTFNYYFPDNVCTYQTGGCVGNPVAGKSYSCCAV